MRFRTGVEQRRVTRPGDCHDRMVIQRGCELVGVHADCGDGLGRGGEFLDYLVNLGGQGLKFGNTGGCCLLGRHGGFGSGPRRFEEMACGLARMRAGE